LAVLLFTTSRENFAQSLKTTGESELVIASNGSGLRLPLKNYRLSLVVIMALSAVCTTPQTPWLPRPVRLRCNTDPCSAQMYVDGESQSAARKHVISQSISRCVRQINDVSARVQLLNLFTP